MESLTDDFSNLVDSYLSAEKVAVGHIAWKDKGHPDYSECGLPVTCAQYPDFNAKLVMTAHTSRVPYKYSYMLVLGSTRIFALDVNPGTCHRNKDTLESVCVTHWQRWPMSEANPDPQSLTHRKWLLEFLERGNIIHGGGYEPPPFVEPQMPLL